MFYNYGAYGFKKIIPQNNWFALHSDQQFFVYSQYLCTLYAPVAGVCFMYGPVMDTGAQVSVSWSEVVLLER